jgi:large subunit ribosomal protein LP0
MPVNDKKRAYAQRLCNAIETFSNILVVHADNVGSKQMQQIRMALRGSAEVIMGKNTTIRRVLRDFLIRNPDHPITALQEHIQGNIGLVFTNADIASVRDVIVENKVPAPARVGAIAPTDVFVEPGPTGCDPGQTSWFQALQIPTRINRNQIEMTQRVHLIHEGEKVGPSEAALLLKLDMKPFAYGLVVVQVYADGEVFSPAVLDITEEDIVNKIKNAAGTIAAIGRELGLPNAATIVHSLNDAFKTLISFHLETDYKFERAQPFADFLADPSKFLVAAPTAGAEEAAPQVEEEESESAGGAGGLFDDDEEEDDW